MNIRRLCEILLHFIFPVSCEVCGKLGVKLCPECKKYLPDEKASDIPEQSLPSLFDENIITRNINGLTIYSAAKYNHAIAKVIRKFKAEGKHELCRPLGKHMAEKFGECEADYIIPVPLHLYSKRKYNHSREIAEGMIEVWQNTKIIDAALWTREVRHTEDITYEDFRFTKDIYGKRVALVDDFCSSGKTLSCLAETCRREGAEVICAYTFACEYESENAVQNYDSQVLEDYAEKRYRELCKFFTGEIITRHINNLIVYSATEYHGSGIREEIHKFKYSGGIKLCFYMGKHMAEKFGECKADYLLPVPLHINSDRGYNQALELAKGMCELWDAVILDAAVWTREVPRRAASKTRIDILPRDFGITKNIRGKKIALIDDVCTSGNTLSCLAQACAREGAVIICAYTLASA